MENIKCLSCGHSEICKYKEDLESFVKSVDAPKNDLFNINITCKKYTTINLSNAVFKKPNI